MASSLSAAILRDLLQRGSHAPFSQQRRARRREQYMLLVAFCLRHFSADFIICMCEFDFRQAQREESALVDGSCLVGASRCPHDLARRPGWTADRARTQPKLIYSEAPWA